ncbi:glycoside hydrolase family 1 protein [Fomitiporia mediterranea MF3/22]|uniref:Glycoside hydrolase family 1 protein n=1 Tax=Fomitiporia mediterranea (strain MF3/22) TaxID=694068 RepID=R7SG18_FOMME|nr:glycoside hydrolase family 1 protein [Fomitiporia mediterranea MF3/22]EJC97658.1 glycoside hydrolase family 1 protein [Fomitiporia mediterranea MF3/22]
MTIPNAVWLPYFALISLCAAQSGSFSSAPVSTTSLFSTNPASSTSILSPSTNLASSSPSLSPSTSLASSPSSFAPSTSIVSGSTSFASSSLTITSAPSTSTFSSPGATGSSSAFPSSAPFIPIGSIPRNYSPEALNELWDLVGEVAEPPFTTTVEAVVPVTLPSSAPPVYPTWYAPVPAKVLPDLKLPKNFKFGVATAAYQVEGATKLEGKGPTTWDWAGRQPGAIADGTNGDIVDLQYLLYKNDTARVSALGLNTHSFSISWARIFPFGTRDSPVNQQGLDHYSDLIDYSISLGVEPVATLFHWDMPLALVAYYGGLTSEEFVEDFAYYASTVFKAYKGRVKTWYTFNEPHVYCGQITTYPFTSMLSPNVTTANALYHCGYYLLKAHARAVKLFREMGIEGEIAFKNDGAVGQQWRLNSTDDAEAVERSAAFHIGMFSEPVYVSGDWPDLMKETLNETLLPRFTDEEKKELKGSADFFAIDAYSSAWTAAPENGIAACVANSNDVNWPACNIEVRYDAATGWPVGIAAEAAASWLTATPQNLRYELKQIMQRWKPKKIYISEFGFVVPEEGVRTDLSFILDDAPRTNYYMTYLGESLLAIHEDNIPLEGIFAWSMIDNAEWATGITASHFGIQHVNYTSLERHFKRSALALTEFYTSHKT